MAMSRVAVYTGLSMLEFFSRVMQLKSRARRRLILAR